jgi:maltose alpha-D-glucosyltransferase/alpha-amylase
MQRMLTVRRSRSDIFGTGSLEMLPAENPSVLAFIRQFGDDAILCVSNLSRFAQPVELNLARFEGRTPVELVGRVPFPRIGELPFLLTLGSYGFYWFDLIDFEVVNADLGDQG